MKDHNVEAVDYGEMRDPPTVIVVPGSPALGDGTPEATVSAVERSDSHDTEVCPILIDTVCEVVVEHSDDARVRLRVRY